MAPTHRARRPSAGARRAGYGLAIVFSTALLIILNGQASVDVLGGLASASLSLTAAVGVKIDPPPVPQIEVAPPGITFPAEDITFIAEVSVGIHISVCWVISISFDGSWEFTQSIHTPQLSVET